MTIFAVTARSEIRTNFTTSSIVYWVGGLPRTPDGSLNDCHIAFHWLTSCRNELFNHETKIKESPKYTSISVAPSFEHKPLTENSYGNPIYFWVLYISLLSTIINPRERIRCICSFRSQSRDIRKTGSLHDVKDILAIKTTSS